MIDDREVRLNTVRRLLCGAFGRDRVTEALYEVLNEGLSFGPRDLPRPGDREWIRGAMAVPLQNATDAALEALAVEMMLALERAPEALLDRIAESRRWQELGWD